MKQPEDTVTLELEVAEPQPSQTEALNPPAAVASPAHAVTPMVHEGAVRLMPRWWVALHAAVAADPSGRAGVAVRLDISRPYISRVMTGHIPLAEVSQRFITRVMTVLMQVDCPHLRRSLPPAQCRDYAARTYQQVDQFEVAHWRACRSCSNNPAVNPLMQPMPPRPKFEDDDE